MPRVKRLLCAFSLAFTVITADFHACASLPGRLFLFVYVLIGEKNVGVKALRAAKKKFRLRQLIVKLWNW